MKALNDVIDLNSARLAARNNHVPGSMLLLLFMIAPLTALAVGCGCGLSGFRHIFQTAIMFALIVLVITVIIDIDRPRRGLIRVSQESMVRLQESMSQASP